MPSPHRTNHPGDRPTAKQLRYLRALADTRGQTFTYPHTKQQASAEIYRLQSTPAENWIEHQVETDRLAHTPTPGDAAAVREHEIAGHGAHAHWTHRPEARS